MGLILPAALDITPVLVPLAAVGLVLLMVGAMITHRRRHETTAMVANLAYLALAGFLVWGRSAPSPSAADPVVYVPVVAALTSAQGAKPSTRRVIRDSAAILERCNAPAKGDDVP